jgi:hypothetical protein
MTTYEDLYTSITDTYGKDAGTVFTADDTGDTLDDVAHGLENADVIQLTTSGTLPAELALDTKYYVVNKGDDDFQVETSIGGGAIDFTDAGSGTHKWHSTFDIPDYRGEFLRGWDNAVARDPDRASRTDRGDGTTGDNVGTKQASMYASHRHSYTKGTVAISGSYTMASNNTSGGTGYTSYAGGNETRPRNVYTMFIIKV